jgi:hypothetical protein
MTQYIFIDVKTNFWKVLRTEKLFIYELLLNNAY